MVPYGGKESFAAGGPRVPRLVIWTAGGLDEREWWPRCVAASDSTCPAAA